MKTSFKNKTLKSTLDFDVIGVFLFISPFHREEIREREGEGEAILYLIQILEFLNIAFRPFVSLAVCIFMPDLMQI